MPFVKEFSPNFNFRSIVSEAEHAGLKLLDNKTLRKEEIPGCMLAWFSFKAEFYRGTEYWFVRGSIDNTSDIQQILRQYFDEKDILDKDGKIIYKGLLNTQESLNNFVFNIKKFLFQSQQDNDLIPQFPA